MLAYTSKNLLKNELIEGKHALLLQILNRTMEIKIFKVIPLNYALLHTLATTSFSYFIIMIQFELESPAVNFGQLLKNQTSIA